jgi:AI-2E family transporter
VVKPIASAALVFGLLIFMLAQREELRNRLIRVVGHAHLTVTTKALEDAGQRITRCLLMQITINGCFGLIVAVALFMIGLPYAFLWGLLAVPLLFIPLIGFWAATALPTILSLGVFIDWWWPLVVIGLFLVLKSVINMLLEPLLYGRSVGVSQVPLLVIIAFWTWLWGHHRVVEKSKYSFLLVGQSCAELPFGMEAFRPWLTCRGAVRKTRLIFDGLLLHYPQGDICLASNFKKRSTPDPLGTVNRDQYDRGLRA